MALLCSACLETSGLLRRIAKTQAEDACVCLAHQETCEKVTGTQPLQNFNPKYSENSADPLLYYLTDPEVTFVNSSSSDEDSAIPAATSTPALVKKDLSLRPISQQSPKKGHFNYIRTQVLTLIK
jgi:hypothetical protein